MSACANDLYFFNNDAPFAVCGTSYTCDVSEASTGSKFSLCINNTSDNERCSVYYSSHKQPLSQPLQQACKTSYEVKETSAKFVLHGGNMKFNIQSEEWISLCTTICIILSVNFFRHHVQ